MLLLLPGFSAPNVVQHLVEKIGLQVVVNVRYGSVITDTRLKARLVIKKTIMKRKRLRKPL